MAKNNTLKNNNELLVCNDKKKAQVKQELDWCFNILECEYSKLKSHQIDYSFWVNEKTEILNLMKAQSQSEPVLEEILSFSNSRTKFLKNKLETISVYLKYIKDIQTNYDKIVSFIDVDTIDRNLRMMMISLGVNLPSDVFGELF